MEEVSVAVKRELVANRLRIIRNTIYDLGIELRVMERVKDEVASKTAKDNLVKFEKILDELQKVQSELASEQKE